MHRSASPRQAGFSLVELTIVVVILGVLAMMAVPQYHRTVERSKATEAFVYLKHVQGAQARYEARAGEYADRLSALDLDVPRPEHFEVGGLTSFDWQAGWQLRLTRAGSSSGYGAYTVTFDEGGFAAERSSIAQEISPVGIGGKLTASSASRGSTRARGPQPTGSLEWSRDEPLSFEEYRARMFRANALDYEAGEDPQLDTMLWVLNLVSNWFYGERETQEETNQRFFDLAASDYQQGEDFYLDWMLSWHYSWTSHRFGWR